MVRLQLSDEQIDELIAEIGLNSTMVRLQLKWTDIKSDIPKSSLNSTMVRLQLEYNLAVSIKETESQFHYGSITTTVT